MDRLFVLKVKYGGTLSRFSYPKPAASHGSSMSTGVVLCFKLLESDIRARFKLPADADLNITYRDVDSDVITIASDEDLHDALVHQELNPLRLDLALAVRPSQSAPRADAAKLMERELEQLQGRSPSAWSRPGPGLVSEADRFTRAEIEPDEQRASSSAARTGGLTRAGLGLAVESNARSQVATAETASVAATAAASMRKACAEGGGSESAVAVQQVAETAAATEVGLAGGPDGEKPLAEGELRKVKGNVQEKGGNVHDEANKVLEEEEEEGEEKGRPQEFEVPSCCLGTPDSSAEASAEADADTKPILLSQASSREEIARLLAAHLRNVLRAGPGGCSPACPSDREWEWYKMFLKEAPDNLSKLVDAALQCGLNVTFETVWEDGVGDGQEPSAELEAHLTAALSHSSSSTSHSSSAGGNGATTAATSAAAANGAGGNSDANITCALHGFTFAPARQSEGHTALPSFSLSPSSLPSSAPAAAAAAAGGKHLPAVHLGVECDGCGMCPIVGTRYKSLVKHNYDLCDSCVAKEGDHQQGGSSSSSSSSSSSNNDSHEVLPNNYMRIERPFRNMDRILRWQANSPRLASATGDSCGAVPGSASASASSPATPSPSAPAMPPAVLATAVPAPPAVPAGAAAEAATSAAEEEGAGEDVGSKVVGGMEEVMGMLADLSEGKKLLSLGEANETQVGGQAVAEGDLQQQQHLLQAQVQQQQMQQQWLRQQQECEEMEMENEWGQLDQLQAMGFAMRDLNRDILRKCRMDVAAAVERLVALAEWDPLLDRLASMDFVDEEMNLRLLFHRNGDLRAVVKDLLRLYAQGVA